MGQIIYAGSGLLAPICDQSPNTFVGEHFQQYSVRHAAIDDVSTSYANPVDLPSQLSIDLQNQHQYAPSSVNGEPVPSEYQYGYWDFGGESPPSNNKRGDPTHNDSYLTMNFTFSYVLKGQSNFYKKRYSWIKGKRRIGRKSRAKF